MHRLKVATPIFNPSIQPHSDVIGCFLWESRGRVGRAKLRFSAVKLRHEASERWLKGPRSSVKICCLVWRVFMARLSHKNRLIFFNRLSRDGSWLHDVGEPRIVNIECRMSKFSSLRLTAIKLSDKTTWNDALFKGVQALAWASGEGSGPSQGSDSFKLWCFVP